MNRRSFLSFLSVAPVALPMAAKAMQAPWYASGGFVSPEYLPLNAVLGERCIGDGVYVRPLNADIINAFDSGGLTQTEWREMFPLPSVADQMRDDDLFDLNFSSVIGESVPQTALSPEQQKEDRTLRNLISVPRL